MSNRRNFRHGMSGTLTYYRWQSLKRKPGGVCLSWRNFQNFLDDMGERPSSDFWLFRHNGYQRSCKNNVEWRVYKRQFRDIWTYLTVTEIIHCRRKIRKLCERGGYDYDAAINELFMQNLKGTEDPFVRINSWIKRYLPRTLSDLKEQRGEIQYLEEKKYDIS